jgi:dipeptide transport system substrate-binding protein
MGGNEMRSVAGLLAGALLAGTMLAGAAEAKTLVYCSEGSPENFNPQINTTGTSLDAARPMYNQLVEFERGSTTVIPGLAESWETSADGKTVTFKLRKGVKFHSSKSFTPSRDFNADDVLFSFNRMWKADHPYNKVSGGAYDYFNDMDMPGILESIEKTDDMTVVFKLKEPNAPFVANMAMDFATILSSEYADAMLKAATPEKVDQEPIGTGPFTFVAYQKDAVIRYKSFEGYWGGKAAIDDLVFAITPDPTARYSKLKAGECHVMIAPNPADLPAMKEDAAVTVLEQAGLNIGYLSMNATKPPFDKAEVRNAVAMSIDRDAIIKEVYQGAGQKAKNFIPPTLWSYNENTVDHPYDPAKAKEMLKAAGVENAAVDLWWMPVQRPYNPNAKRMAEMMQADLAKVGINAELKSFEWGEYRKRLQAGEHMMGLLGWTGDNGDPDNFYFLLGCPDGKPAGQNISKWCNADFQKMLVEARNLSDNGKRTELYQAMQKIAKDEAAVLTVAHSTVFEPIRKEVDGYKVSPFGRHEFYGVDIK